MNEHRRNEQNKSGLLVAEERRVGQQGTWIACELIETMLRGEGEVYHRRSCHLRMDKLNSWPRRILFTGKIRERSLLPCSISGSKIMQEFALKMRWTRQEWQFRYKSISRWWNLAILCAVLEEIFWIWCVNFCEKIHRNSVTRQTFLTFYIFFKQISQFPVLKLRAISIFNKIYTLFTN